LAIESIEFVAAANALVVDKNLGDCPSAIGPIAHLLTGLMIAINFIFREVNPFPPQ
jgi:hypothetical protein